MKATFNAPVSPIYLASRKERFGIRHAQCLSRPVSVGNYSPFGVTLHKRDLSLTSGSGNVPYRYGFQGQEMDDEISGKGNSYSADFWQYSPRIGRRWNIDPVIKVHESSYAVFANNPIWFADPNGADTFKVSISGVSGNPNLQRYDIARVGAETNTLVVLYPGEAPMSDFKPGTYEHQLYHNTYQVNENDERDKRGAPIYKTKELWEVAEDSKFRLKNGNSLVSNTFYAYTVLFQPPDKTGINKDEVVDFNRFEKELTGIVKNLNDPNGTLEKKSSTPYNSKDFNVLVIGYHSIHKYNSSGGIDPETNEKNKTLAINRANNLAGYLSQTLQLNQGRVSVAVGGQAQERKATIILHFPGQISRFSGAVKYVNP